MFDKSPARRAEAAHHGASRPSLIGVGAAAPLHPAAARYALHPGGLTPGNHVDLLINGEEAFPAMLDAINGARDCVHLETYILVDDDVGHRFARALCAAARRGVAVRVMFDSVGSVLLPSDFINDLAKSGVEVIEFRPLRRYIFTKYISRRDHRKILVVDGRVGFTGGLNVSEDYVATGERPGWRDTHVRVLGPAVRQLDATFQKNWKASSGASYTPSAALAPASQGEGGSMWAGVLASDGVDRPVIREQYLHAIRQAQRHIVIGNAYFVPDRRIVDELERAAGRGVEVDIIVPERSDVPIVQAACEYLFERLLRAGIRLHYWQHTHMHAKTAVIDGVWSVVGSYNLDGISHFRNKEVVLQVLDDGFAARMVRQFEKDRKACDPLRRRRWERRPLRRRLFEWACYRVRDWL